MTVICCEMTHDNLCVEAVLLGRYKMTVSNISSVMSCMIELYLHTQMHRIRDEGARFDRYVFFLSSSLASKASSCFVIVLVRLNIICEWSFANIVWPAGFYNLKRYVKVCGMDSSRPSVQIRGKYCRFAINLKMYV